VTSPRSAFDVVLDLGLFAPIGLAVTVAQAVPELAQRGRERVGPQLTMARALGQLAFSQGRHQAEQLAGSALQGRFGHRQRSSTPSTGSAASAGAGSGSTAPVDVARSGPAATASAEPSDASSSSGPGEAPPRTVPTEPGRPAIGETLPGDVRPPAPGRRPRRSPATAAPTSAGPVAFDGTEAATSPPPPGGGVAVEGLAIPSYDSLSASQVVQRLAGLSRAEVEAVRAYEAATRGRRTILTRASQLLA
jgi:hypothetical protein